MSKINPQSISKRLDDYLSTSRNKSYFVAFVTVFFVIIVILAGIVPAFKSVTFQITENKKRDVVITKLENKIAQLKRMTTDYTNKKNTIEFFYEVYPTENDQAKVIEDLANFEEKNNVHINALSFTDQPASIKPLSVIFGVSGEVLNATVNINFEGERSSISNFVKSFESSARIYNIRSLSMTKKSGSDLGDNVYPYQASLVVEYFYVLKI